VIDSTVIPLDACVELIVDAARARTAASVAADDGNDRNVERGES
jgi:hypothetical protein